MKDMIKKYLESREGFILCVIVGLAILLVAMYFAPRVLSQLNNPKTLVEDEKVKPVRKTEQTSDIICNLGSCDLHFKSLTLKNVPENFGSYLYVNKYSGGIAFNATLLKQIADQLVAQGNDSAAAEVNTLAEMADKLAAIAKMIEEEIKSCEKNKECLLNLRQRQLSEIEQNNTTVRDLPSMDIESAIQHYAIGWVRSDKIGNPAVVQAMIERNHLTASFLDQFDKIMALDNLSDFQKNVIREIYWVIGTISEDFNDNALALITDTPRQAGVDPLSGEPHCHNIHGDLYENYVNYKNPKLKNLKALLNCAMKKTPDQQEECHQVY
jgi:hypothetical protein